VEVISLTGATMVKTSNTSEIDATKLAKGTYIVKVTQANGTVTTSKLIKK
jgi:hypothetical protein